MQTKETATEVSDKREGDFDSLVSVLAENGLGDAERAVLEMERALNDYVDRVETTFMQVGEARPVNVAVAKVIGTLIDAARPPGAESLAKLEEHVLGVAEKVQVLLEDAESDPNEVARSIEELAEISALGSWGWSPEAWPTIQLWVSDVVAEAAAVESLAYLLELHGLVLEAE